MTPEVISPTTKNLPARQNGATDATQGFGQLEQRPRAETAAEVLAAQGAAAVQARYVMAAQHPRDWDAVRQRLLRDCERSSFANVARYRKPVGQGAVAGFSVRFAEAALRAMGNALPENQIIYDDREKRIVRVTVTDLEANVTYSKELLLEKTVERRQPKSGQAVISSRVNSKGEKVYLVEATEDDLMTKEAALTSKALRQAALRLLPGDIQEECEQAILATQTKQVAQDPDAEKKRIIDAFDDLGIRVADVKTYLGADDLASLTPKDLLELRAVYQAIKDGETNWREVMEQREAARGKKPGDPPPAGASAASRAQAIADSLKRGKPGDPS